MHISPPNNGEVGRSELGDRKVQHFTDLDVWKEAHALALLLYEETKDFPKEELFGLTSQMRRAVVSVPSNIAEGFARQSIKEKVQFYSIACGSLNEIQSQILIAKDLHFLSRESGENLFEKSVKVHKILNGLLSSTRRRL